MSQDTENRFEQHKGKVYAVMFLIFMTLVVIGGYLGYQSLLKDVRRGYQRHIVLREVAPLSTKTFKSVENDSQVVRRADENGFVEPARIHDIPDFEVVFLGGSTTVCNVIDEKLRFPHLAGRLLEKATDKKVNAYNGGKSGNASNHSVLNLLGKVVPMKPDAVVMMHAINDLNFLMITGSYWTPHPHRGMLQDKDYNPIKKFLIEKELGHNFLPSLRTAFDAYKGKPVDLDTLRIAADYRKMLELFVFICRQHDITPVLMTQASRFTAQPGEGMEGVVEKLKQDYHLEYSDFQRAYSKINETTRQVAIQNDVLLIDLAQDIEPTSDNMYDSVHLTTQGSKIASRSIAAKLQTLLQ